MMYEASEPPVNIVSQLGRRLVLLVEGFTLAAGIGFIGTIALLNWCAGPLQGQEGIAGGAWILVATIMAAICAPVGLVVTWIVTSETSDRGFDRWQWLMCVVGLFLGIGLTQVCFANAELGIRIVLATVVVPVTIKITRLLVPGAIKKLRVRS